MIYDKIAPQKPHNPLIINDLQQLYTHHPHTKKPKGIAQGFICPKTI